MRHLSISQAWDESRAVIKRDGRLLMTVALAMIALPTAIMGAVSPGGLGNEARSIGADLVALICSLIALAGQLALIRLALNSGETVGTAITHGLRRMPIFLLAFILVGVGLFLVAIPFGAVLAMAGVPIDQPTAAYNPLTVVAVLLYIAFIVFFGVRLIMGAPVAAAEPVGIFGILRRAWQLTAGHWWRLLAFVLMIFIAMLVVLLAVGALAGIAAGLAFGPPNPLSATALVIALVQGLVNAGVTLIFMVMLARIYAQLAGGDQVQASVPSSGN